MPHLEGREIGGCKLIRKIGAGGMGDVYLAEQIRVGNRSVAIKVVSPEDLTFHPDAANDIARRFEREAAILGNLSHPNILPVHDSGIQDGMLYLVMEYAPDGSLADAIRGTGKHPLTLPLPLPFAADIINQVASALSYTHQHGVVHRDVKPGNVLIRVEPNGHWHVLLADFGVARSVEVDSQRTQVTGTFIYMAPEQFSAKFSPASDQYALAVMTFQLLAGKPPFDGDLASLTRAHMYEPPPSLHAINPIVPAAVDAVLARGLAKDPAKRYPSVADFNAALRTAAGVEGETTEIDSGRIAPTTVPVSAGDATVVETPTAIARAKRRSSPWRVVVTVASALVLLALLIGGEQYLSRHTTGPKASATQTPVAPTATSTTPAATGVPIAGALPTCNAALQISDDANCIPAPPTPITGAPLLNQASPDCGPSDVTWTRYNNTGLACSAGDGTELTATSTTQLGCVEAQQVTTADGYASIFVTQGSGSPVLAFRQGEEPGQSNTTVNSTGYFFKVSTSPQGPQFVFYRIDSSGSTIITNGSVPGQLAQHFVMGVLYSGNTFNFYVNGRPIGNATDSNTLAINSGWYGACVDGGMVAFRSAQDYKSSAS
jgi:tRNA A-37 threonylcarbamoyl transferase component Bud32